MQKEKKILLSFGIYLLTFVFICLYGITHVSAQVISSSYLDTSVNNTFWLTPNGYRQANSSLVVDSNSSDKYIVIDLCDSLYSSLSITNVTSSSGNVTFYKHYAMNKSCQIDSNNTGTIDRLYFMVNSWADAGNGNFGVIFNSRLNSLVNYNSVVRVLNINTSNTIDISDLISNNQDQIKDGLNNIQGSITDSENNINNSINDSKNDIIDNQDKNNDKVIENNDKNTDKIIEENNKNFQSCRDSYNLLNIISTTSNINGLSFSLNDNKSILINGTSTNQTFYSITNYIDNIYGGKYLRGSPDSSSKGTYSMIIIYYNDDYSWAYEEYDTGNGLTIKSEYPKIRISILIRNGVTLNNVLFEPMITTIDNKNVSYEPFGEQVCTNKLDEANETSKGILGTIKNILSYINPLSENFFAYKLVELIINGLKSLIVPDNFDFINNFKTTLENKLGFIASIPLQLVDYLLSLKDKVFTPMTSITFPKISFFGFSFWNDMTIDITEGLSWVSSIKYLTDLGCVIIMINTLRKWYENFTGGDEK